MCAFTTLKGIFAVENPKKTALAILVDKEEIGSTGNTGMLSAFFEMTLAEIIEKINGNCTITDYNTTIENSACLSSESEITESVPANETSSMILHTLFVTTGIL